MDRRQFINRLIKAVVPYGILWVCHKLKLYCSALLSYLLHNKGPFENELSVVGIMKDEGPYLKEWIEYHKLVGVEKFYLYDDGSTDSTDEVLAPYIASGEVVVQPVYGTMNQLPLYTEALYTCRNKSKWLAVIDVDEFIVPVAQETIPAVLSYLEKEVFHKDIAGLAVHWVQYGFGGQYAKPEGLVIENYTKNDGMYATYKSIVNPRMAVSATSAHGFSYILNKHAVNEKGIPINKSGWCVDDVSKAGIEAIRINHYYTKSYEEYIQKSKRNRHGFYIYRERYKVPDYDPEYLSSYDDYSMEEYVEILHGRCAVVQQDSQGVR